MFPQKPRKTQNKTIDFLRGLDLISREDQMRGDPMVLRDEIVHWIDNYLDAANFDDSCPNGLQVEGVSEINQIVVGVSVCQALFEASQEEEAQMVIAHHGLIWKGLPWVIKGVLKGRLEFLLRNGITLLGYHLPLDAHPEVGNNVLLAKELGIEELKPFGYHGSKPIGWYGHLATEVPRSTVLERIEGALGGTVLHFDSGRENIRRVGVISGGAAKDLHEAIDLGLDLFLTGEAEEPTYEICREANINFVAGGHYRTERLGIQALGEKVRDNFGVPVTFFETPNPV
jgi:dinuclear metal center YbgI/SA1388 family protein